MPPATSLHLARATRCTVPGRSNDHIPVRRRPSMFATYVRQCMSGVLADDARPFRSHIGIYLRYRRRKLAFVSPLLSDECRNHLRCGILRNEEKQN